MTARRSTVFCTCCGPDAAGKTCRGDTGRPTPAGVGSPTGRRTAPGNGSGGHSSASWMPRGSWFGPRPSWTGASCPQKGGRSRRVDAEGQGHQMDGRGRRTWRPYRGPFGQCATGRDHPDPGDAGHGARPLAAGTSQDQAASTGRRSGLRQPFLPPQPAPARDSSLHPAPTVAGTPTSGSSPAQLSGGVRLPLDRGTDLRLARQLPALAGAAEHLISVYHDFFLLARVLICLVRILE